MSRILVTGGAGYIGSICVEECLNAGHKVAVFDNLSEGHRKAVDERARFFQGDLCDKSVIKLAFQEFKPDAVMHFAADAKVGESMQNPAKYFENNVCNTLNLLNVMVESGVKRFVFSSTCATFGAPERVPLDESLPQRPINPYGESKLMVEQILRWYGEIHGIIYVALRYFNASGASERFGEDRDDESHLIPNVLNVARGRKVAISIFGTDYPTPDGTCIRDYIHIRDLSQAHMLALDAKESACYNLGTGNGTSVREIIDTCRAVTGHPIPVIEEPRREGDPPKLIAASEKIRRELGWKPQFESIHAIVDSAWKWMQANPDGYGD